MPALASTAPPHAPAGADAVAAVGPRLRSVADEERVLPGESANTDLSSPDGERGAGSDVDHAGHGEAGSCAGKVLPAQKFRTSRKGRVPKLRKLDSDPIHRWQVKEIINRARTAADLTEEEIANRLHVSQSFVSRVFRGVVDFPARWVLAIDDETFARSFEQGIASLLDQKRAARQIESQLSPLEALVRVHAKSVELTAAVTGAPIDNRSAGDLLGKSADVRRQLDLFENAVHRAAQGK